MRTVSWIAQLATALLWAGCDPMELDVSDDDTGDDDTGDDDIGDDDTGDDDTGDDDIGDDDSGDDDSGDDDACSDDDDDTQQPPTCDVTVPTDQLTVQAAIDAAAGGEVICVEPGTYFENLDFGGKDVHVFGIDGPAATILDGAAKGSVVVFQSQEGPGAVLEGFTVTHGLATSGGGILAHSASPTLRNLVVESNEAVNVGGGIWLYSSSATLTNMHIRSNQSVYSGGGIHVAEMSVPVMSNVVVEGNSLTAGDGKGGGFYCVDSTSTMTNVVLAANHAVMAGGLYGYTCDLTMTNVAAVGNEVTEFGAGLEFAHHTTATLTNVLVAHNSAQNYAGGIQLLDQDNLVPVMSHCKVYGNTPLDFSEMPDPTGANGNLSVDPLLLDTSPQDPLDWDLHLGVLSPLIDAGDPAILDPDGSPSDIGAYGGPGAGGFDLDFDGYGEWWLSGPYDPADSWCLDCNDGDPAVYPGNGC